MRLTHFSGHSMIINIYFLYALRISSQSQISSLHISLYNVEEKEKKIMYVNNDQNAFSARDWKSIISMVYVCFGWVSINGWRPLTFIYLFILLFSPKKHQVCVLHTSHQRWLYRYKLPSVCDIHKMNWKLEQNTKHTHTYAEFEFQIINHCMYI